MNLEYIFKIVDKEEWNLAKDKGFYSGSTMDLKDGYIHFSNEEQVQETLKKHYSKKENLVLLKIHTLKLDHLLWEQASNGNMYPHLYSKIDIKDVKEEYELELNSDGTHKLPSVL